LGRGGYRGPYDESTARELISIGKYMLDSYACSMSKLQDEAGGTRKENHQPDTGMQGRRPD